MREEKTRKRQKSRASLLPKMNLKRSQAGLGKISVTLNPDEFKLALVNAGTLVAISNSSKMYSEYEFTTV